MIFHSPCVQPTLFKYLLDFILLHFIYFSIGQWYFPEHWMIIDGSFPVLRTFVFPLIDIRKPFRHFACFQINRWNRWSHVLRSRKPPKHQPHFSFFQEKENYGPNAFIKIFLSNRIVKDCGAPCLLRTLPISYVRRKAIKVWIKVTLLQNKTEQTRHRW